VLAGIVLLRLLTQILEQTLVLSFAETPPADIAAYAAVRDRTGIAAALLGVHTFLSLMAGYVVGKIAGEQEVRHALVVAALQLALFAWAFATVDSNLLPPMWARVAMFIVTAPALAGGATVRADARALDVPFGGPPITKENP